MGNSSSSEEDVDSDAEEEYVTCHDDRYKLQPIKNVSGMRLGDQIATLRHLGPLDLYYHHAIFIGESEEKPMIGFGGLDWDGATEVGLGTVIHKTTVDTFRHKDDEMFRVIWPKGVARKPAQVVLIAEAFLAAYQIDPAVFGKYNITKNNCEHFASYCKTGLKVSQQVEDFHEDISDFFNLDWEKEEPQKLAEVFVAKRQLAKKP